MKIECGIVKRMFIIFILLVFLFPVFAMAKQERVAFSKCVDGDTIKVKKASKEYTVRFLAIDTPETVKRGADIEPFGTEASQYTCKKITNADEIVLEYDPKSEEKDKYGRLLAWVYVDNQLLQAKLIEQGYAQVAYLYDDYLYTNELQTLQKQAKQNKKGMWSLSEEERNGCVIDGKIEKKSSGLCKDTNTKEEKKAQEKQTTKKQSFWEKIGHFFDQFFLRSIKQIFYNLF